MKGLARLFGIGSDASKTQAENTVTQAKVAVTEKALPLTAAAVDTSVELQQESDTRNNVQFLDITKIIPNPFQPRKTFQLEALQDLAASIQSFGVIQPLLVRQKGLGYELVAGERRLRASKMAKLTEVPVIVKILNDTEMAEIAMIENLQREDLHFLEEAEGFSQLLHKFGFTQEELAKRMGKSQSTIANKLRLLKLSIQIRTELCDAKLTERHARALLKLSDEAKQQEALLVIIEKSLNVRDTELLIQEMLEEISQEIAPKVSRKNVVRIVRDVRIFLNTINQVVNQMKQSGLKVKVQQEQSEEYITVKMIIPKHKKK